MNPDLRKQAEAAFQAQSPGVATPYWFRAGFILGHEAGYLAAGKEAIQLSVLREHEMVFWSNPPSLACTCCLWTHPSIDANSWPGYLTHLLEVSQVEEKT